jgi:hypothetical protein
MWCEERMHIMIRVTYWATRDVNGEFTSWSRAWFKDHLVDGLDRGDNWLSCMRRKEGHLRTYTMRPHDGKGDTSWRAPFEKSLVEGWSTAILWAPRWEERMRSWRAPFQESLVDGRSTAILWAPWWEERMRSWRAPFTDALTESLLDGWKCAATAVYNSRQGRMDKDVCGSRD